MPHSRKSRWAHLRVGQRSSSSMLRSTLITSLLMISIEPAVGCALDIVGHYVAKAVGNGQRRATCIYLRPPRVAVLRSSLALMYVFHIHLNVSR